MLLAAKHVGKEPRMLSFKCALTALITLYNVVDVLPKSRRQAIYHHILITIGKSQVGHRPDRIEPRAVKRRMKRTRLLMEPRSQARNKLKL